MSKADKLFEELGYSKSENEEEIVYILKDSWTLYFGKVFKEYCMHDYPNNELIGCGVSITIKEHKAIHEKMKELGWLDE